MFDFAIVTLVVLGGLLILKSLLVTLANLSKPEVVPIPAKPEVISETEPPSEPKPFCPAFQVGETGESFIFRTEGALLVEEHDRQPYDCSIFINNRDLGRDLIWLSEQFNDKTTSDLSVRRVKLTLEFFREGSTGVSGPLTFDQEGL